MVKGVSGARSRFVRRVSSSSFLPGSSLRGASIGAMATMAICFAPMALLAQTAPSRPDLLGMIAKQLPPYWHVDKLVILSSSKSQGDGSERLIYKFDLTASPEGPLYAGLRQEGPFEVVTQTLDKTDVRHLTGVADMTSSGESWNAGINIDQDMSKFGQPIDRFGMPTLIAGASDTKSKVQEINSQVVAKAEADLKAQLNAKLAKERETGEALIRAQRQSDAAELLKIISDQEAKRQKLIEEAAAGREKLIADQAQKRGELIAKQREQLSELSHGLATEQTNLVKQIRSATDILKLQAKLRDNLGQIAANDKAAMADFNAMHQHRLDLLGQLPKKWIGTVTCSVQGTQENKSINKLEVDFGSVLGAGWTATFRVNQPYNRTDGTVILHGDGVTFPMQLDFAAPNIFNLQNNIVPTSFQVSLTKDGHMQGQASETLRDRTGSRLYDCTIDMSG